LEEEDSAVYLHATFEYEREQGGKAWVAAQGTRRKIAHVGFGWVGVCHGGGARADEVERAGELVGGVGVGFAL